MDGASMAPTSESHGKWFCWLQGANKAGNKETCPQIPGDPSPGHVVGSGMVVLGYEDERFPTSRSVSPCLSQLQLDQEGIVPK